VPSDGEWLYLSSYSASQYTDVAKNLKSSGSAYWGQNDFTNLSGFSALPAGFREGDGTYPLFGSHGIWWASTEINQNVGVYRLLYVINSGLDGGLSPKIRGYSIRCIKN
jgi:uncharacterized protein (TIGR02145 family)